jgi:hypothetical protein
MPDVNLPLSGNVTQTINPWTAYLSAVGSQFGLININVGTSSDPQIEQQVIADVASYGKQLGRVEELLLVLLENAKLSGLTTEQARAVDDFKRMATDIADIKERHKAPHVLRPRPDVAGEKEGQGASPPAPPPGP